MSQPFLFLRKNKLADQLIQRDCLCRQFLAGSGRFFCGSGVGLYYLGDLVDTLLCLIHGIGLVLGDLADTAGRLCNLADTVYYDLDGSSSAIRFSKASVRSI